MKTIEKIKRFLEDKSSKKLKIFNQKLIPNIDENTLLGIRIPDLRVFAKELFKSGDYVEFLTVLPHKYHEENHLHAFIVEQIKDFDECLKRVEEFLPYIDNWAVCDCFKPVAFKKNKHRLLPKIEEWINGGETWKIRFAVNMLMTHFLDEYFNSSMLDMVASISSQEYYVKMMVAWFFATALAKQYQTALPYIENKVLPIWTHNKTIQKAIESYRITQEQKDYLRRLKIKESKND